MGKWLVSPREMAGWMLSEGLRDAQYLVQAQKSGQQYFLFSPKKAFLKAFCRNLLAFMLLTFFSSLNFWWVFLLPMDAILLYRHYLLLIKISYYNLSPWKFWLITFFCILVCIPISFYIWRLF